MHPLHYTRICPIREDSSTHAPFANAEATRRGCGAALLRKPAKLARLVAGIAAESPLPLTVKIRTGESEKKINAPQMVEMLGAAGAAAVTVHGRTMEQR
jgi:tRNA-dihydrouridine synthase 3